MDEVLEAHFQGVPKRSDLEEELPGLQDGLMEGIMEAVEVSLIIDYMNFVIYITSVAILLHNISTKTCMQAHAQEKLRRRSS